MTTSTVVNDFIKAISSQERIGRVANLTPANPKYEKFAQELTKRKSASEAYVLAGYSKSGEIREILKCVSSRSTA